MKKPTFRTALETAWEKRAPLREKNTAFRVLNGSASGTPGLIVDKFGDFLVVYAYDKDLKERYGDFAYDLTEVCAARGIALKDRSTKGEDGREGGRALIGEVPEMVEVREGPFKFMVHLQHPRNVGLFLDTRPLRETLVNHCRRHDVLNLFSYSCSLGVAASLRNQGSVVNVDISARYLGWGKENTVANGLDPEVTKFLRMDTEKYLDWATKKAMTFDVIILDPPSFSRSKTGTYSFEEDYFRLMEKCAKALRPGGIIHALTNFGQIKADQFHSRVTQALTDAGRPPSKLTPMVLPIDFDGAGSAESGEAVTGKTVPNGEAGSAVEGTLIACEVVLP
jgi:23S rRNA (cytosine1962-C5)-methyltransferase